MNSDTASDPYTPVGIVTKKDGLAVFDTFDPDFTPDLCLSDNIPAFQFLELLQASIEYNPYN